ncbi:MAG: SGNH/GDSL hydrolase family protein [Polyangiaceae bacterium]
MGSAGPTGPRFIGRFDSSDAAAPVFAWSGTAISLRFQGTAISATLSDGGNNVFEVVVDGKHSVLSTQAGTRTYGLATGLDSGAHELLLYRRSEAFLGATTFNGFDLPVSAFLPGDPVPARRLEVIGDSISAGYGNEGTFPCSFGARTENHYLTYGALAARTLGAELYTEAWSGIGVLRNNDGSTANTMPQLYPRTLPGSTTSVWNFAQYTPDAVLINLGSNDFAKGDPGPAFQTLYTDFVKMLRGHYPAARFFLAVGPTLVGTSYTRALGYLRGVVGTRAMAGDQNLVVLEFGTQDVTADGIGCDYHPSLKTHQKMADKMVSALKADLVW